MNKVLGIVIAALACSVVLLAVALLVTRKHDGPNTLGFFGNPPKTEEFLKGMNDHTKQFDEMLKKMEKEQKEQKEQEQSDEDK